MQLFHAMVAKCDKSSYGAVGLEVGGMGCIKAANQLILEDEGEWREIGIFLQELEGDIGKIVCHSAGNQHCIVLVGIMSPCLVTWCHQLSHRRHGTVGNLDLTPLLAW